MIEVRFQKPKFSRTALTRYVRGSIPPDLRTPASWQVVKRILYGRTRKPFETSNANPGYLMLVLSPNFEFSENGLYLHGAPPHGVVAPSYARANGLFQSEGLNNHVHLRSIIESPVGQFDIGVHAIRSWANALEKIENLRRAVIYLTGPPRDFLLCVYSDPDPKDLAQLERRIGKVVKLPALDFIGWAF